MTSCSNILYDGEQNLYSITLEDMQSFLCDIQRLDLIVNTYGNYQALECQR